MNFKSALILGMATAVFFGSCKTEQKSDEPINDKETPTIEKSQPEKKPERENVVNLLKFSEDYNGPNWVHHNGVVVQQDVFESPEDFKEADLIDISKDFENTRIAQVLQNQEAGSYIFSIYLRALNGESGAYPLYAFASGSGSSAEVLLAEVDSQWRRFSIRISQGGPGDIGVYVGNAQASKDASIYKVYAWGAQLEKVNENETDPGKYKVTDILVQQGSGTSE